MQTMTAEQKKKMQEGRAKAKAAAAALAAANPQAAAAAAPRVFKPAKTAAKPLAKGYIPKGTPIAGVQSVLDEIVTLAKENGVTVTRCAGTLRLY